MSEDKGKESSSISFPRPSIKEKDLRRQGLTDYFFIKKGHGHLERMLEFL